MKKPVILIVDDDEIIRTLLSEALDWCETITVNDGYEAIDALMHNDVCLLLTDVVMPRLGGLPLARHVKQTRPRLPILMMTGYSPEHEIEFPLILKPFSMDELEARVRELLA